MMAWTRVDETAVFIAVTGMAILGAGLGMTPGSPLVLLAAAALAAAAGLPHGALDPLAAREAGVVEGPVGAAAFLAGYSALALMVIAAWIAAPIAALAGFLLISAWHFGGDWFEGAVLARWFAGLSLLSLPAALHGAVVADIYAALSGEAARELAALQAGLAPVWFAGLCLCAGLAAQRSPRYGAEIVAAGLAALVLHPLVFFALYFALLHSARHFLGLWRAASDRSRFVRSGMVYTAISFIGAAIAFAGLAARGPADAAVLQVVFVGLAALTLPHMALMEWIKRRRPALR